MKQRVKKFIIYSNFKKVFKKYFQLKKQSKKAQSQILCFGDALFHENVGSDKAWPYLLQQKLKTPLLFFGEQNITNDQIYDNIVFYCDTYKPKTIYIVFQDCNTLSHYSPSGIKPANYYDLYSKYDNMDINLLATQDIKSFIKQFHGIRRFLYFIRLFKYIEVYCKANNIRFYWFANFKEMKILKDVFLKDYFSVYNFVTCKNVTKEMSSQQLHEYIATQFYNITD